ncbi:hypothetical protein BDW22DRAFT_36981 [Trametopsis cervina]|nr:hypothetical protein BDW22DRAFT_36981 [Trametopsis cervina]
MPRYSSPTKQEVRTVSRKAIDAFAHYGLKCVLVGGVACALYGNSRTPTDVDLVILTSVYDPERLKELLVQRDSTFYLRPARTFGATYKVLWARLVPYAYQPYNSCKVDILVPGIMNIPDVPTKHILSIDDYPVMPMIPLLLLKLQAWEDHRNAVKDYLRDKQWQDVRDINEMLDIAARRGDKIKDVSDWVPQDFIAAATPRVSKFLEQVYLSQPELWKAIGVPLVDSTRKQSSGVIRARVF